jgi:hypothetical protein
MAFWKKSASAADADGFQPGITPRSLIACILCMLLAGMYTQYSMVILGECYMIPEAAMPVPALNVILLLVVFVGLMGTVFKLRILTKPEIVCVAFATIMSVPLMTQGFWHRFLGVTSAPLRNNSFDYIDAYSDDFWPHGPNVLKGTFDAAAAGKGQPNGEGVVCFAEPAFTNVVWGEVEYEKGVSATLPTITNASAEDETWITFKIPVKPGDRDSFVPENPHLISFLAHTDNGEAETEIFCRSFTDDNPAAVKLASGRKADKKTYLHKLGYVRIGSYGVTPGANCQSNITVQLGLKGRGSVTFADPKLMSVYALEAAFRSRKMMTESEYKALPPDARPAGIVIKPDNMWSLKGLTFLIKGYIPIREWLRPAAVWGSYMFMLCLAFFCINVMMRKKWAESERYPMPNTRIPLAMIGAEDKVDRPFSSLWRNRWAWGGVIFAFIYGILKGAHYYNPHLPDLVIRFHIGDYITNPVFGNMFKVSFEFSLFICAIAVFFALTVLLSIVVGYWLVRSLYFFGHITTIDINSGFPWFDQQAIGAYIGYFLVIIALSRKYIWGIIKDAFKGTAREPGDAFSSRVAVILFVLCHVGVAAWAVYTGTSMVSMLIMFCFLVLLGFVSAKYRAECGTPFTYFTPYNAMLFVAACGGITVFGTTGMLVSLILSGFLTVTVFYLIPGIQFEIVQIGKRMKIQPRHIVYTCLLGLLGGLFIGGWVFLSNAYSMGGDNIKFQWAFNGLNWFMNRYRTLLNQATVDWLRQSADSSASLGPNWGARAMVFSGTIMVALTLLRQFFAGFWFHPLGFLLGFTNLNSGANWGTLLIAWAIRSLVLKIGGAKAVRDKLLPFFAGCFIGCILSIMVFTVVNTISSQSGSTLFYPAMP